MVLKQGENIIRSAIRKKNFFVFNTQLFPSKAMLTNRRGRFTYLLKKNPQIRL